MVDRVAAEGELMPEPTQLERLARPFPQRLIHDNPSGGGSYVKHSVVTEKLLAVLGPFNFELVEIIRGHVEGIPANPNGKSDKAKRGSAGLDGAIVGVVCRLSAVIDGTPTRIEETGDCEQPHNWPHDGARLKDAMSDALKRAAMRIGVTLHLWSGAEFSLYEQLQKQSQPSSGEHPVAESGAASSPTTAGPATSKARVQTLVARCLALRGDHVDVSGKQKEWNLPDLDRSDEKQLELWAEMLGELERALEAPM